MIFYLYIINNVSIRFQEDISMPSWDMSLLNKKKLGQMKNNKPFWVGIVNFTNVIGPDQLLKYCLTV